MSRSQGPRVVLFLRITPELASRIEAAAKRLPIYPTPSNSRAAIAAIEAGLASVGTNPNQLELAPAPKPAWVAHADRALALAKGKAASKSPAKGKPASKSPAKGKPASKSPAKGKPASKGKVSK